MAERFIVPPKTAGQRVDRFLTKAYPGRSRRRVRAVIDDGAVRVAGRRVRAGELVRAGDEVVVERPPPDDAALHPTPEPDAPLTVLHEDAAILALYKPAGVATHPLRAGEPGSLASALVARYPECLAIGDDPREAGLAHRLDIDTSGVILAARTPDAWHNLRQQFSAHRVGKRYLALCAAAPGFTAHVGLAGECRAPIGHDRADRRRARVCVDHELAVRLGAQAAHTVWRIVREVRLPRREVPLYLVEASASTGRMHQVRTHLAFVGLPLAGDALYGEGTPPSPLDDRHVLHAEAVSFDHPLTGVRLTIQAPLPTVAGWLTAG